MRYLLPLLLVVAACTETVLLPELPVEGPVLHIGNGSSEDAFIFYRAVGSDTWIWAAEMPAATGLCKIVAASGPTVVRAEGRTSGAAVEDTADLSVSADWQWDFVVPTFSALKPIPQFCPTV